MTLPVQTAQPALEGARLVPLAFDEIAGWAGDDHAAAFAALRRSCEAILARGRVRGGPLRDAVGDDLMVVCQAAVTADADTARDFFEGRFSPHRIVPDDDGAGFVTAYFEPVSPGSPIRTERFSAPLLKAPSDLVRLDGPAPGLPDGFEWARRMPDGSLRPHLTRAEIDGGALDATIIAEDLVLAWLDPVDLFYVHIQGSARIALEGGEALRVTFAAKTGHPYTAIGRVLVRSGALTLDEADMAGIRAWLEAHPGRRDAVLHANASYIFFEESPALDPSLGPIGAEGVPLTPGRSLAVDRFRHAFGLPIWVAAEIPSPGDGAASWARLMVAQDTGSAILGPARGDLFLGSGDDAGRRAGPVATSADMILFLPRGPARP